MGSCIKAEFNLNIINGDLIDLAKNGNFDVIIHGCNCFCTMGAGIAKVIKQEFPEAYLADLQTEVGSWEKLGSYSLASIRRNDINFIIVNAYTQYNWKGKGVKVDYLAIRSVFSKIKQDFCSCKIAYPMLGAGLAGGDWNEISRIIDSELQGLNHTLVKLL